MAIYFTSMLVTVIITLCVSSASPNLVLNLVRSNKIYSLEPLHVSQMEEASIARVDYLQSKARGDIISHITPNVLLIPQAFLVNISIGSPRITQQVISHGFSPCTNCYGQSLHIFNPSISYTYHKETCRTSEYSMPSLRFDAKSKSCEYSMKYMDGTGSRGTIATETLMFNTIYGESSSAFLPNVVFGCGYNNYGNPLVGTGLLGLGYGELSLVHRFVSKFSYCFGSLEDPSYPIGDDGANILGDTTPLDIVNGLYFVKIEAISVDGTILPIDPAIFQRNYLTGSGGTILDTGNSLTTLAEEAYEQLKNNIEDVFDGRFTTTNIHQDGNFKLECYKGDFERDLVGSGFPIVRFHFSGGAELSLDEKSLFFKSAPNEFCLAVTPSSGRNLNIIGVTAQQSHNIGYDLKAMKVSFENIDCGVLFDY